MRSVLNAELYLPTTGLKLVCFAAWKPNRGYDGTPNESVQDLYVRARQVRLLFVFCISPRCKTSKFLLFRTAFCALPWS